MVNLLRALDARQNASVTTQSVEVHNDNVNPVPTKVDRFGGKGEVHGIRARLYMKMASGTEIMREFSCPEKLSEKKFPWKD